MHQNEAYFDHAYQISSEDGLQYRGRLYEIDEIQKIYVESRGKGPPLIFVPGYGGDAALFLNLANALSEQFTTITYDRRGNSRSNRGWIKVSLEQQADDIAQLLNILGHPHAGIVSSSNGASIALTFMLRHPDRLDFGILHEPFWSAHFLKDPNQMVEASLYHTRTIQSRREKDCGELEARLRYLGGDDLVEYFSAETRRRMAENTETGAIERMVFSKWIPTEEQWQTLSQLPLQILVGKDTLPFFAEVVGLIEKKLKLRAISVPGGHGGFVQYAEEIASIIRRLDVAQR